MAKLLSQCLAVLKGEEEVKDLWARSGVCWDDLGMQREDLEEFLERQVRQCYKLSLKWVCFVFFRRNHILGRLNTMIVLTGPV